MAKNRVLSTIGDEIIAGKNKIINGDFGIWQRGTSFSSVASGAYSADRWKYQGDGTTNITISRQSFSPGNTIAGYEPEFFYRFAQSSASGQTFNNILLQPIEDVRTFAGQTVTYSFWGKADASRTFTIYAWQAFGSGGSSTVFTTVGSVTLTTSWQRFTYTFTFPSISGKTIGTASSIAVYLQGSVNTAMTLDFWGVQLEAGSVATPFATATGTLAGELAACQRYYYRSTPGKNFGHYGYASSYSTSATRAIINLPVTMRVVPTSVESSNIGLGLWGVTDYTITGLTLISDNSSFNVAVIETTGSTGLTAQRIYQVENFNNTAGYLAFSAEL